MALKMALTEASIRLNANAALERVAVKIEKTAKEEFGVYQPAVGPFEAWPQLAESTQERREKLGFTPNDPLLMSGDLRDTIEHRTAELETEIGSDSDIMVWQEFGAEHIPPRPVLGPAAERNHDLILEELGGAVVAGIIGGDIVHHSLGYSKTIRD
jgi:hypothetical protein